MADEVGVFSSIFFFLFFFIIIITDETSTSRDRDCYGLCRTTRIVAVIGIWQVIGRLWGHLFQKAKRNWSGLNWRQFVLFSEKIELHPKNHIFIIIIINIEKRKLLECTGCNVDNQRYNSPVHDSQQLSFRDDLAHKEMKKPCKPDQNSSPECSPNTKKKNNSPGCSHRDRFNYAY